MKIQNICLGLIAVGAIATLGASPALADGSKTFVLDGANSGGPVCSAASPCAEVTVDVNAAGTSATITVSSLLSGYVFDTFGFNSSAAITLVPGSGTGELGSDSLAGPGAFAQDGWGKFDYLFDTGKNGGSSGGDCVVTGGTPGAGCTFSFEVSGTGLTLADFEVASTKDSNGITFFAGHMANQNGPTGFAGDSTPFTPTPEPASMLLLGSGLLAVGGFARRRMTKS
jgi:hypothetical protein